MYSEGRGVETDMNIAFDYYLKAAKEEFTPAMNKIGLWYLYGDGPLDMNPELGCDFLLAAANKGDGAACFNLAMWYESQNDQSKKLYWLQKSAETGNKTAILLLENLNNNN